MSASGVDNRPIPNSYWVVPGRFAAGEYPGAKYADEAAVKLEALLGEGIDHFIDLTTESSEFVPLEPYKEIVEEAARKLGATLGWERHPIIDVSVPSSPEEMARILNAIDSAMSEGKTVYVHCWGGGRSDRYGGRLLAGATWQHRRRGTSPDCRVVEGCRKGLAGTSLARNEPTA